MQGKLTHMQKIFRNLFGILVLIAGVFFAFMVAERYIEEQRKKKEVQISDTMFADSTGVLEGYNIWELRDHRGNSKGFIALPPYKKQINEHNESHASY